MLGWRAERQANGYQVEGQALHHGIVAAGGAPTLYPAFAVDDIAAAVRRVREAGGEAGEVTAEPWGQSSMCAADQGMGFTVFEPSGGVAERNTAPSVDTGPGDLVYVTIEVVDSAKARAFYGAVLGWHFTPGSVPDGWRAEEPHPMAGISGGHTQASAVPMYQTSDVAAAVERVREAGGTSSEPEARPYGLSAGCTDDQGTRFGLLQP